MNIVKLTNKIALVSVFLLMYWVFIFISTSVFSFNVFRENMTEMFLLSILGLFSILSGVIILNIMYNLTAIAEARQTAQTTIESGYKRQALLFLTSLAVIFSLLYAGDYANTQQKEKQLIRAATELIEEQKDIIETLTDYTFGRDYIERASQDLKILGKVEEKFPAITVITRDSLNAKPLLLGFSSNSRLRGDESAEMVDYILSTSAEERQYLNAVFDGDITSHRFTANNNRYEIYYPVKTDKGLIVIHLAQYSRYGKLGS